MRPLPLVPIALALLLAACAAEPPAGSAAPPTATAVPETAPPASRDAVQQALAENRLHSPAGSNAVELYLALREGGDTGVESALVELAPWVMMGVEQATSEGDFDEAVRLIGLLRRIDAEAPALPRLDAALAAARQQAEAETLAEAESPAPSGSVAAVSPAPANPVPAPRPAAAATTPPATVPARATPAALPTPPPPVVAAATAPPATAAPAATPPAAATRAARTLLSQVAPRYPDEAKRRRLEGVVTLQLRVGADGRVVEASVLESSHALFEREAVLAARRWRYAEAPGEDRVRVAMRFSPAG